jgi:tetratricopeptide (TPR) repeat protein
VLYATGLVESPEVKNAWRAAQSLRRDPNQGLTSIVAGYKRVLSLNPNHERSLAMIDSLATAWTEDITAALAADDLALAEAKLTEALGVFPADEALHALHDNLGNLKRAESLVASTEALLRSRGLDDLPSATTAIQAYHEVLRLHPTNARARVDLDRLARHYGELAGTAADDGDVTFAMSYLQLAASANPNYPTLTNVREEIQRATTLRAEIQALLQQADNQLAEGVLVNPPGNNAAELYRRVLATDPDNEAALDGLLRVTDNVQARANRLLASGRIDDLTVLVERAGEVGLNESIVQTLQQRLNAEAERIAELEQLLVEAREMYRNGFITAPADANAVDRLVRVLRLDPQHEEAMDMLRASGERLAEVAKEAHEAGLRVEARQYLQLALGLVPEHDEWRRLLDDWTDERSSDRRAAADPAAAAVGPSER